MSPGNTRSGRLGVMNSYTKTLTPGSGPVLQTSPAVSHLAAQVICHLSLLDFLVTCSSLNLMKELPDTPETQWKNKHV